MRDVRERLETQRDALVELSADLDAFVWEIEEALRNARHGDPEPAALAKLSERAAGLLAACDKVRPCLPPRIADVMVAGLKCVVDTRLPAGRFALVQPGELTPEAIERLLK